MSGAPLVSVVMSAFNEAATIGVAVESILRQTFTDLELIVVDDGSTDATAEILSGVTDPRLRVERQPRNVGLTRSLNRGLSVARGQLIARLDADDLAYPRRLERQVARMLADPALAVLGTAYVARNPAGRRLEVVRFPAADLEVRWRALFSSPFAHPTVLYRRSILEEHRLRYDEGYPFAEDYDLWTRILRHGRGANLREALISYRVRARGITGTRRKEQLPTHDAIVLRTLREVVPEVRLDAADATRLRRLFAFRDDAIEGPLDGADGARLSALYLDLLQAFARRHRGAAGLEVLLCREAMRVALILLRRPITRDKMLNAARAARLGPPLPGAVIERLSRLIRR
jgi:hypothetical protein